MRDVNEAVGTVAWLHIKGQTIRKVMGGGGEKTKKFHAREYVKKKNSCKEEGKEKKFVQKEGPTPGPAI